MPECRCCLLYHVKKPPQKEPGLFNRAELFRKLGTVLQGFEVGLGKRIIIVRMRETVASDNAQINEQFADGF